MTNNHQSQTWAARLLARATPRAIAIGAIIFALLIGAIYLSTLFPLREWVEDFTQWTSELGLLGPLVFAAAYILAIVLLVPAWPFSVAAGFAFGVAGIPIVVLTATVGATIAFLTARYLARQTVTKMLRGYPVLQAIDEAISEEGWKVVVLLRLSPVVPFSLKNYFLGATDIRVLPYVLATFFGIMPGAAAYVYLGTLGRLAAADDDVYGIKTVLLVAGLVATFALVSIVSRKAKRRLDRLSAAKAPRNADAPLSS